MNGKNIKAIADHSLCMKCLKNKATHIYHIHNRGYGSEFDGDDTKFQCCDQCNKEIYNTWFNEKVEGVNGETVLTEKYQYENNILELIHNLPLVSQSLF